MTLPRWEAIQAHWKEVPPIDVSTAAFVGTLKPKARKGIDQNFLEAAGTAGLGIAIGKTPEWAKPKT